MTTPRKARKPRVAKETPKRDIEVEFQSIGQAMELAGSDKDISGGLIGSERSSRKHSGNLWSGTEHWKDASELMSKGWAERPRLDGLAKVTGTAGSYAQAVQTVPSVQGAFPDIGEFLMGSPENMVDFQVMHQPRIIKIGFNLFVSATVNKQAIERRGALILALVDALEASGYGVEVDMFLIANIFPISKLMKLKMPLKKSNAFLDSDCFAFFTCHPSAFRRFGFALMEGTCESDAERKQNGFTPDGGYCRPFNENTAEELGVDILIEPDMFGGACSSDRAAVNFYHSALAPFIQSEADNA